MRAEIGDPAYAGGEPPAEIDGLVPFHEVFPWSFDLTVTHDGRRYAVLDCYCLEPACRCDEVVAQFIDLSGAEKTSITVPGAVRASVKKIRAPSIDGPPLLRALWRAALQEHGATTFRGRFRRMRKVARQRRDTHVAAPARSTKISRNTPCPCGSGKKYKRCCGASVGPDVDA